MTIYAVTAGEYSAYRIIALTVNKERAEHLAKIYKADIEEYEDAQGFPAMPKWRYAEGLFGSECYITDIGDGKERMYTEGGGYRSACICAEVFAEDEAHARKKAQDMIAKYKAEQEGIT